MNKQISKIINAILAIAAIICFLALDFYGFGSSKNFTGADILEMIEDTEEIWPILFIIIPIIQIIVRFATQKLTGAILCGTMMMIPVITALANVEFDYLQVGFYIYAIISLLMIFTPILDTLSIPASISSADIINQAHTMSDSQLQEIIAKPEIYNSALVSQCKEELDIRTNAQSMMPEVETYSKEKIDEILKNRGTYSAVIVFCCEKVKTERIKKEAEELRKEQERIAKEKEEKRKVFWAKWRWVITGAIAAAIAVVAIIYFTSNEHYFSSGINYYNKGNYQKAIKKLSKIDDVNYAGYLGAKFFLHKSYTDIEDNENASKTLIDIYNAVADLEADELRSIYYMPYTYDAYNLCANAILVRQIDLKDVKIDYNIAIKLYEITGRETQIGICYYHTEDFQKAYNILEEEARYNDNIIAKVYLGLMYTNGKGCPRDIHSAFWTFDKVDIEDHLTPSLLEEGTYFVHFMGELWNVDIIRNYLIAKGDLQLIYGTLNKHSNTFGEGVDIARKCYAKATELFPYFTFYAKRHHYIEQLYNIEGQINNTNNFDDWYYCGEYIKDHTYPKSIRPYGYGMYHEYGGMWDETLDRLVIGNFGKSGRSFTWGKDALVINRNKDSQKVIYYVGYYDKDGEYYFFDEYVTD